MTLKPWLPWIEREIDPVISEAEDARKRVAGLE